MSQWSDKQIEFLKNNYLTMDYKEISKYINRTPSSVRNKCYQLKLRKQEADWTESEINKLKEIYNQYSGTNIDLEKIAKEFGRTKYAICIKAKQLGLTQQERPLSDKAKKTISVKKKDYILKNGHPRGMLGKKHSSETILLYRENCKKMWADPNSYLNSEEYRQLVSDRQSKFMVKHSKEHPEKIRSRAASGKREDLGIYVRSAWEANYARYLNWLREKEKIVKWEYEVDTFWFEHIKRGCRSYTPDFKVWLTDQKYEYHEVKGYMDQKSRTKLDRMARYYPKEKVVVIGKDEYNAIKKWSRLIPNWE